MGQLLNQAYDIQTYIRTCGQPGKVISRSLCVKNALFDKKKSLFRKAKYYRRNEEGTKLDNRNVLGAKMKKKDLKKIDSLLTKP